jgi:hypothetical protein
LLIPLALDFPRALEVPVVRCQSDDRVVNQVQKAFAAPHQTPVDNLPRRRAEVGVAFADSTPAISALPTGGAEGEN